MKSNHKINPKISLIIPVYNVEKYLKKCLDSVVSQTFNNFEAIIINDGSTDKSLEIAQKYTEKYSYMTLISRENKGLSETRNEAIDIAKGEYLAFLDSDDFLDPNFLKLLYDTAIKNEADISCCNYNLYYPKNNKKIFMFFRPKNGVYSKESALKKLMLDITFHSFACNKLIKKDLFFCNNIKFCNRYFEDISTSPKLFYYSNKVAVIDKPLYYYTSRRESILGNPNEQKINDLILSFSFVKKFLIDKKDIKKYKIYLWIFAQRLKFVSAFFIFQMHFNNANIEGLFKNLNSACKSLNFFFSKKFNKNSDISAPYLIKEPVNKRKI